MRNGRAIGRGKLPFLAAPTPAVVSLAQVRLHEPVAGEAPLVEAPSLGTPQLGGVVDLPDPDVLPLAGTSNALFTTSSFSSPNGVGYPIPEWSARNNNGTSWTTTPDKTGGFVTLAGSWASPPSRGAVAEGPGAIQIGSTWYLYFAAAPGRRLLQVESSAPTASGWPRSRSRRISPLPPSLSRPELPRSFVTPRTGYATNYIDPSPFYDPTSNKYYLT